MAISREGAIVGPISGRVGGVEFAQTRYGSVVRKLGSTTDKRTAAQLARRARFVQVVQAWSGLAEEVRAAWRAAAGSRTFPNRLGIERYLTGFQVFVLVNMEKYWAPAVLEVPPLYMQRLPAAEGVTLAASASGVITVEWTVLAPPFSGVSVFRGVRTVSTRARTVFRGWRHLGIYYSAAGDRTTGLDAWWDPVLGHPVEGEVVAVQVAVHDLLYLGSFWVQASTVTVA